MAEADPAHRSSAKLNNDGGENSLRLLKLVNTLLDFSLLEAGRLVAVYQATDFAALTANIAAGFRSANERAGLQFQIDITPLAEPVYVDPDMWERVVLNLVSNAFKFTFEGGVSATFGPGEGGPGEGGPGEGGPGEGGAVMTHRHSRSRCLACRR